MAAQREKWLDTVRGFAIMCVVFEHACERTEVYLPLVSVGLDVLRQIIISFQMAIFFSISGFLYSKNSRDLIWGGYCKAFIQKKFWDLYFPYATFGVLIWIGKTIFAQWVKYQVSIRDLFMILIKPISFVWFLYALFLYETVVAVLDYVLKKRSVCIVPILGFTVTLLACWYSLATQEKLNKVLYYISFYILGIAIERIRLCAASNSKKYFVGVVCLVAYSILFCTYYVNQNMVLLFFVLGVLMVIAFFSIFSAVKIQETTVSKAIELFGQQSLYIYIIHPVIEHGVRVFLVKLGIESVFCWIIILTVTGILIPVYYYVLSNKIFILNLPFKPRMCIETIRKKFF